MRIRLSLMCLTHLLVLAGTASAFDIGESVTLTPYIMPGFGYESNVFEDRLTDPEGDAAFYLLHGGVSLDIDLLPAWSLAAQLSSETKRFFNGTFRNASQYILDFFVEPTWSITEDVSIGVAYDIYREVEKGETSTTDVTVADNRSRYLSQEIKGILSIAPLNAWRVRASVFYNPIRYMTTTKTGDKLNRDDVGTRVNLRRDFGDDTSAHLNYAFEKSDYKRLRGDNPDGTKNPLNPLLEILKHEVRGTVDHQLFETLSNSLYYEFGISDDGSREFTEHTVGESFILEYFNPLIIEPTFSYTYRLFGSLLVDKRKSKSKLLREQDIDLEVLLGYTISSKLNVNGTMQLIKAVSNNKSDDFMNIVFSSGHKISF